MTDLRQAVLELYAAFGRGDVPAILNQLADDVAWEAWADNRAAKAGVPWLQPRHGKAGAASFFQDVAAAFEIHDFQVLAVMPGETQVAAELVLEATIRSTGRRFRDEEVHLWTFNAQGQIVRLRHYADTAKHIWAAGL